MCEYLIKRVVLLVPTFIGITLVVYAMLLLLPGDPVDVSLGQEYDPAVAQRLRPSGAWTSRSCCNHQVVVAHSPGRPGPIDVFTQTRVRRGHGQVAPHPGAGRPGPLL